MSVGMRGQGRVEKVGFWWSGGSCGQGQGDRERYKGIEVGCGERVGWLGRVKEGGVGRGAESAGDISGEGSVFDIGDGRGGRVDGEGRG